MKNVLIIVSHIILPPNKSWSKLIYEFSRFLKKNKNISNVSVVQPYTQEIDKLNWSKFLNIMSNSILRFFSFTSIYKIIKYIKENSIDTVIIEYPWLLFYMIWIKLFTRTHLIMHEHNIEYDRFRSIWKWWWRLLYLYEYLAYNIVDDVFFITKDDQKLAKKSFWFKGGQYCPYWIDETIYNDKNISENSKKIRSIHNISEEEKIILFFWSHTYYPNRQAIDIIEKKIAPWLIKNWNNSVILICWWWLPKEYHSHDNIIYIWFVNDIVAYIKWCNIMINPIISWWWVKTKVIESLACWKTVVSTKKWAEWIDEYKTNSKLLVVENNNWNNFVDKIVNNLNRREFIWYEFIKEYEWSNIINSLKI